MACYGLYKDKYVIQTKVLPPHPWDSLVEFCQDFFEASFFPGHKRLVFCFTCADQSYKLDLSTAKSATVICAVGITFGLGGYILYKLYCKFIHPLIKKPPKKKNSAKRNETQDSKDINGIDSEKSMGNTNSNKPETSAYFSPVSGVALHVGRKSKSRENLITDSSRAKLRKRTKRRKTSTDNELTKSAPVNVPSGSDKSINLLTNSPSDVDFEGSLKANVSLHSLNDRNMRDIDLSRSRLEFLGQDGLLESNFVSMPKTSPRHPDQNLESDRGLADTSNKENFDNNCNKYQIELSDDLLTVSSVLLTPPSEDDSHIKRANSSHCNNRNPLVLHDNSNLIHDSLSSQSSGNTTDSKKFCTDKYHVSAADESCSCDEKDSVSSLPKLRSPDRFFRESLMNRLHECHTFAGSSNSSSLESSPEFSPYARYRKYSIETDNLSGLATPDSEIFNSCCDVGRSTEDQFEHLEEEVIDIEEEFASLTNKLNQLKNMGDSSSIEYSPSHPLARKAVEIVDRTRSRLSRSRSVSGSSNDSSPAHSFDMPDLSWDSEGLHGDNSNKSTPSRRLGECSGSLRNRLHAKLLSKNGNGCNGISYESPMETDIEKDGTLDNLSTDDCFDNSSHSGWTQDSSSKENSKSKHNMSELDKNSCSHDSAVTSSHKGSLTMSSEDTSSSVYESARDSASMSNIKAEELNNGATNENFSSTIADKQTKGSVQVSQKMLITEYVDKEWRGQTDKANTIRQAYKEIPRHTGCNYLCQIRGDNYCGLRGTLFQCLRSGINLTKLWPNLNSITDKLAKRFRESNSGLKKWTFANRLSCKEDQQLSLMTHCVSVLYYKFEEALQFESQSEREHWIMNLLNSESSCDLHLMEGLKLLMFLNILDLHDSRDKGEDIPIFVWLLFARDTSETPSMFVRNHLNSLGDSGGIEQIEMYLLGHTLGVRIQVLRLSHYGQEDFIAYYPDDADNNWSQVSLIAEDDRHYNVPVP